MGLLSKIFKKKEIEIQTTINEDTIEELGGTVVEGDKPEIDDTIPDVEE